MKIDANSIPDPAAAGLQQSSGAEGTRRAARLGYQDTATQGAEANAGAATDEVSLSELSQEITRLSRPDPARESRIERLAADYSAGKLEVDVGRVASKVVDDAFSND